MPRLEVLCIGGANLDGDYRLDAPLVPRTSNPASARHAFGGVARNVAENLARLGRRAGIASAVGDDAGGRDLLAAAEALGIDTAGTRVVPGAATSRYIAIHDADGEFVVGVNSMRLIDEIGPDEVAGLPLDEAGWAFLDANLPAHAVAAVIARRRDGGAFRLAVDTVAVPKAVRLPADLAGVDLLCTNADEANAILGTRHDADPAGAAALARGLLAHGAAAASVSIGQGGVVVADAGGTWHVGIVPAVIANTSGAGDARIAGTLHGLLAGLPLVEAARQGSLASALAVESDAAIAVGLDPRAFADAAPRLAAVGATRIGS